MTDPLDLADALDAQDQDTADQQAAAKTSGPKPLAEYQGNDLAGLLNDLASKLSGTGDLPQTLRFGQSGAAAAERATGTATPAPHLWFIASGVIIAAVAVWQQRRRTPAQGQQQQGFTAPGAQGIGFAAPG